MYLQNIFNPKQSNKKWIQTEYIKLRDNRIYDLKNKYENKQNLLFLFT